GLLRAEYRDLDALCADDALFANAPDLLKRAHPRTRQKAFLVLLDYMRVGLAVDASALRRDELDQVRDNSLKLLRAPWGFSPGEEGRQSARWLIGEPVHRDQLRLRAEELLPRGRLPTAPGRALSSG